MVFKTNEGAHTHGCSQLPRGVFKLSILCFEPFGHVRVKNNLGTREVETLAEAFVPLGDTGEGDENRESGVWTATPAERGN